MQMESHSPEQSVTSYGSSSTGGAQDRPPHASAVTKRKRTQRLRAFPSPPHAVSEENYPTTEEEEDTANCLILLAQGGPTLASSSPREEKFTSRKFAETITTAGARAGFYVYECKTCNKCFPSFQALGGHRASHKKSKTAEAATTTTAATDIVDVRGNLEISMNSFARSSNILVPVDGSGSKLRVHECSICGSEFASGQALGGHMRRHRPVGPPVGPPEAYVAKKEKEKERKGGAMLSLDLNLPAPSEETVAAFAFADQRQVAFSERAAALVDCHY